MFQDYFQIQAFFLGNSLNSWLWSIVIFFAVLIALKIFKSIIVSRLKALSEKTKTQIDDIVIGAINNIHWPFYVMVSLYAGSFYINLDSIIDKAINYIFLISVVYYVIRFVESLIDYGVNVMIEKKGGQEGVGIIKLGGSVVKIVIWVGAVVLILSNMGYNVTSLIAGLGIGGIAVALALQNVLGDLFSSLTILLDKPFKVGDFIVLGENYGTVERVGIKSTRIILLQGEELVVSNSELTNSQIRNFGKMNSRRIVFNIGVVYGIRPDLLEKIPEFLREIIEKNEKNRLERVHFKEFGDFSLIYEAIFYVNSPDYGEYMDIRQKINLDIARKFEKEEIDMAFPTQTIELKK
ncbi:mechanosensitive ion channel family protein [bacterium]|nr:mechanosensitive ion channel family protein [bacterium]